MVGETPPPRPDPHRGGEAGRGGGRASPSGGGREGEPSAPRPPAGWPRRAFLFLPSRIRRVLGYLWLTLKRAHRQSLFLTASALAYISILSAIPLLAAFSFIGERVFVEFQRWSLEVFSRVLPYSNPEVTEAISELVEATGELKGLGLVIFLSTTLLLFTTVEETFNRIWKVGRTRPFRVRLLSFLLFVFWTPLLVGATFSGLLFLTQSPLDVVFEESAVVSALLFVVKAAGLTMLYWLVPYTRVRFRYALGGGIIASLLLGGLRWLFTGYIAFARGASVVYGSYAFALFFAVSLDLTWTIVLLGSEFAYTSQHYRTLTRGFHRGAPPQSAWVGLAAVGRIAQYLAAGKPTVSRDRLSHELRVPALDLERMLLPLVDEKILRRGESRDTYLLSVDAANLPLTRIFAAYDSRAAVVLEPLPPPLSDELEALRGRLEAERDRALADVAVADLVAAVRGEGELAEKVSAQTGDEAAAAAADRPEADGEGAREERFRAVPTRREG